MPCLTLHGAPTRCCPPHVSFPFRFPFRFPAPRRYALLRYDNHEAVPTWGFLHSEFSSAVKVGRPLVLQSSATHTHGSTQTEAFKGGNPWHDSAAHARLDNALCHGGHGQGDVSTWAVTEAEPGKRVRLRKARRQCEGHLHESSTAVQPVPVKSRLTLLL